VDFAIIHSLDGYDELSLTGDMKIVRNTGEEVFKPIDLGFQRVSPDDLYGGATVSEASLLFDSVLENRCTEAQKNVVLVNSAIAMQVIDPGLSFTEAVNQSRESIESGKALSNFKRFIAANS
jgi:anthranilate phosphoribosyltransferase